MGIVIAVYRFHVGLLEGGELMFLIVSWIVSAIVFAWSLISGVAGIAGAASLATAFSLLPNKTGQVTASWVNVANYYMPVNEAVTFFLSFCAIASLIRIARWTALLKK